MDNKLTVGNKPEKRPDLNAPLTCNSLINFSAIFGSDDEAAAAAAAAAADDDDEDDDTVAETGGAACACPDQDGCRVPQKAAAGAPPISIMLVPWTCIIVHITQQHLAQKQFPSRRRVRSLKKGCRDSQTTAHP